MCSSDLAVPGSGFVMVESEFVFGGLKSVLDRPAVTLNLDQDFDGCSERTPGGEKGHIPIGDRAPDQQTPCPKAHERPVVFLRIEIGEFEISPVVEPRAFAPVAGGQTLPSGIVKALRDLLGGAADRPRLGP